jgi:glucokinase
MVILAGDLGGTKTRVALFEANKCLGEEKYVSRSWPSLIDIMRDFLKKVPVPVEKACFGVAGPVREGRCLATNLPWVIDAHVLSREFKIDLVWLINDLEANAYGLRKLAPQEFCSLNEGEPGAQGNAALISAGTGLGEAGLYWDGKRHHPFACEGGHADFPARSEIEVELWRYLYRQFGHVSCERVLSGPGLYHLYRFLVDTGLEKEKEPLAGADLPRTITERAEERSCPICVRTVSLFAEIYGSEAGNLALKILALGGVYVGGGIAPHILGALQEGNFMKAFLAKGRFAPLLSTIPVKVVLNEKTALLGAWLYAQENG